MINDEELISNVEQRIAYDNSQKEYAKGKRLRRRLVTTLCSLFLICALTFVADAATDGAISKMFKAYIYKADGTREEMPLEKSVDAEGHDVYSFKQELTEQGLDLTLVGEYVDLDGKYEYRNVVALNPDGTVNEDVCILNYEAESEEDAEEFAKMIEELNKIPTE